MMDPKQRAAKLAQAYVLLDKAYSMACQVIEETPDDDDPTILEVSESCDAALLALTTLDRAIKVLEQQCKATMN